MAGCIELVILAAAAIAAAVCLFGVAAVSLVSPVAVIVGGAPGLPTLQGRQPIPHQG